jgi:hemolysin D
LLFQILPEVSENPGQEPESFQKKERELLQSALLDFKSQKKSFETKHEEIVARSMNLQARIETINTTLPITSQLAADTKELAAKGSSSKHDSMRLEQERLKLLGELKDAEISLRENEEKLKSSAAEQEAFLSGFLHKLRESISESAYQIQQAEQEWNRINYREKNMLLTSPVAGTIYQLGVHTIGAIAQSGQTTMLVVPENDTLEVVVEIKSKDVGFLHVGQNAEVKVDAYPYVRHGSYKSVIVQISPDTIKTGDQANKEKPFLCTLTTRSDISQPKFSVLPGMSVLAEIKTGSRPVISYLLSPLSEALDKSFKER